jgi:uncharacterized protein (DUF362 family)/NAD-dependent dihydropyrimidine dehydrogenase PreA subunit
MDRVIVKKCDNYDACQDIIFDILDSYHLKIEKGTKVLIKPNLVMPKKPETAVVTHYKIVKAVVLYVENLGGIATIADSPGGPYQKKYLDILYKETKMTDACSDKTILNYDNSSRIVENKKGIVLKKLDIIEPYFTNDIIINIAKLKTHCFAYYTGATKNLFGFIPGLIKAEYHYRFKDDNNFSKALIDICEFIKPTLSIIDGIDCMEGEGPTSGKKKFAGIILAGENPYTLDSVAIDKVGLKKENCPIYNELAEKGMLNEIEVLGDNINLIQLKEAPTKDLSFLKFLPKPILRFFSNIKNPIPKFDGKKCVLCGNCVISCPAKTLKIEQKKIQFIDKDKCIKCYCCHELCPHKAVII